MTVMYCQGQNSKSSPSKVGAFELEKLVRINKDTKEIQQHRIESEGNPVNTESIRIYLL